MSQRLLETDFPSGSGRPQVKRSLSRDRPSSHVRPVSSSGSMPKNLMMASSSGGHAAASEWQYEPTFRTGSMSRVQTSFSVNPAAVGRTGSLRKAFTTSDEEEDLEEEEARPLTTNQPVVEHTQQKSKPHNNNSQSSTSDYHSDENPNLLPVEHRELPQFRLHQLQR